MKKLTFLFLGLIAMPTLFAQGFYDALRFSTDDIQGTARFRSMSGAFGALGGDMSAISLNPAGSAIFTRTHSSISFLNESSDKDVRYFNELNSSSNNNFDLNQAGVVFVFENTNQNSSISKFVLGLSYEQTQNYEDDFFVSGTNTRSIDSFFLANAQGLRLDEISAFVTETISAAYNNIGNAFGYQNQQAFLGYESFIIEPDLDEDANTNYYSNIAPGDFYQEYSYAATGYNGKFTINGAIQLDNTINLGINLNSHFINYSRSTYLYEGNSNSGSLITDIGFENNLLTEGNGFSFQMGGIAKVNDNLRVGLTYDSPIWYTIYEETTQYLATDGEDLSVTLNPEVINIFPDYKLQTPGKITGSAALVINKTGLISFDYSRKDYGNTKFKPTSDQYFASQNVLLNDNLKAASTYRIGGELKHNQLSFRGGYRFEESPFIDTDLYGNLTGYSLGLGYNFGGTKLDLAYENSKRETQYQLYAVGLTDSARIDKQNSNVTLTLSFTL